jgi:hypothetical protein
MAHFHESVPEFLKQRRLKIAVVFLHEEFLFES